MFKLQVIRSLKRAMQPAVTNVNVKFDVKVPKVSTTYECPSKLPNIYAGEKMVAYGLADVPKDQKSINGTATLSGEIRGKRFKHTVPFSSQLHPTEHTGTYPAHRLAAKALVTDWQDAGKSKETITSLSIESSVISKYTAFIAVDEETAAPVEGALQTWDVRASPYYDHASLASSSFLFQKKAVKSRGRGGAVLGFGGASKGAKKKSKAYRSAPLAAAISTPKPEECLQMECEESESDDDDEEFSSTAHVMKRRSASAPRRMKQELPMPCPSVNFRVEHSERPADVLSSLIAAQQADGSWKLDSFLATILSKTMKKIEEACPVKLEKGGAMVWATVLVLTILETKCKGQQEEWELIAMKADKWLKKQVLPSGTDISILKSAAKTLM